MTALKTFKHFTRPISDNRYINIYSETILNRIENCKLYYHELHKQNIIYLNFLSFLFLANFLAVLAVDRQPNKNQNASNPLLG